MKRTCTIRVPREQRTFTFAPPQWSDYPVHEAILGYWSNILIDVKKKLDKSHYNTHWSSFKEYVNKYERVFMTSNHKHNRSIAMYVPLSRSYFKLWELLYDFKLLEKDTTRKIKTAHLAEGPGGFVEATCNYRSSHSPSSVVVDDVYFGITLIEKDDQEVPDWKKSRHILQQYPQIRLHYGLDNTGNLYKIENIHAFVNDVGRNTCTLVTGDGGIDYSGDYTNQEALSHRLFVAQIYTAFLLVQQGQHFVCKMFDTNELFTQQMLWLLSITFDTVHIVKPYTSRVANSERYIVACGYQLCSKDIEQYLCRLLSTWDDSKHLNSVMSNTLPPVFVNAVHKYNEWYAEQQCISLKKSYSLIDSFAPPHNKQRRDNTQKLQSHAVLKGIVKQQEHYARTWCKRYNVAYTMGSS